MNVFADLHHAGLYYSFHLLFEKRLGANLYRPIGKEWFSEGFWDIAKPYKDNPATIDQYLSMGSVPDDGTPPLNNTNSPHTESLRFRDEYHEYDQKAITIDMFKNMEFDYIIASIPDHWETYKRLRDKYQPKAKVLCHMGNMFNEVHRAISEGVIDNLMASTIEFPTFSSKLLNRVFYYQEQPVMPFIPSNNTELQISSFVHILPQKELFEKYKAALPEITFKAYGASSPDGWMPTLQELYKEIQKSRLVWHVKPGGDGYGWNWHSAMMLGRPVITNFSDYKDKLGGKMFVDEVTGIDLEARPFNENVELIKRLVNDPRLAKMQEHTTIKFHSLVDYDMEAKKIQGFLLNSH